MSTQVPFTETSQPTNLTIKGLLYPIIQRRQAHWLILYEPLWAHRTELFPFTPSQVGNDPVIQKQTGCTLIKKKSQLDNKIFDSSTNGYFIFS